MEKLEEAGYPREQMFSDCESSDLYVFVTPLTKRVIDKWLKENGWSKDPFVKTFNDQITGKPMYDIAFQYTPYWEEKARESK